MMYRLSAQYRLSGARRTITNVNINDHSSCLRFTLPAEAPRQTTHTASSSAGTWTQSVSTLVRSLLAAVPPQGFAPDHDVLAVSDEDCATVAVEFRRWIEQRICHQQGVAAASEGQMAPSPPPPPPPPRPGASGRPPTAQELDLDDWSAYVAEGEAAAEDEQDYLGILDSACTRTCHCDA